MILYEIHIMYNRGKTTHLIVPLGSMYN